MNSNTYPQIFGYQFVIFFMQVIKLHREGIEYKGEIIQWESIIRIIHERRWAVGWYAGCRVTSEKFILYTTSRRVVLRGIIMRKTDSVANLLSALIDVHSTRAFNNLAGIIRKNAVCKVELIDKYDIAGRIMRKISPATKNKISILGYIMAIAWICYGIFSAGGIVKYVKSLYNRNAYFEIYILFSIIISIIIVIIVVILFLGYFPIDIFLRKMSKMSRNRQYNRFKKRIAALKESNIPITHKNIYDKKIRPDVPFDKE